jgi:hypothetical protein
MSTFDQELQAMPEERDFAGGSRGRHVRAYRAGHTVRVRKSDGTLTECHFTLQDGAVLIDPDLTARFPDSEGVNQALRAVLAKG